jgi:hypothetical protein
MLKKAILLGCALFTVSFPSFAAEGNKSAKEPNIESRPLNQEEQATIKAWVNRALKDPDSAKFLLGDRIMSINGAPEYSYCGLVNTKNSYGGYSGWVVFQSFIAKNKNDRLIAITELGQFSETGELGQIGKGKSSESILLNMCKKTGYFKGDYINADLIGKKVE